LRLPDLANEASGRERQFVEFANARVIAECAVPPKSQMLVASSYRRYDPERLADTGRK